MVNAENHKRLITLSGLILMVALSRLLPHPPNFSPVATLALFGGASLVTRKWAFIVPLIAMLLSDIGLEFLTGQGFHSLMPVVYMTFAITVGIGIWTAKRISVGTIIGGTLAASVLFFVVTNFAVWVSGGFYPKTPEGLLACYTAAIPFFGNTLMGNFVYVGLMFGGWAFMENKFPVLMRPRALPA